MSENWVVQNIQNALSTWNEKLAEIWQLLTQSVVDFKGGGLWQVILKIHGALQSIGLALLVLFFLCGIMKTCGSLAELKDTLAKCREQGFAVDEEEYYDGIHCVAVPVYAGNKVIAALSVTSSVFAYSMEEMTTKVRAKAETASRAITADLY